MWVIGPLLTLWFTWTPRCRGLGHSEQSLGEHLAGKARVHLFLLYYSSI